MIDTTSELAQRLFPTQSPLLANLSVNVAASINHNTWVRNREANIEIYTTDPLAIRDSSQTLSIHGVITTDRGDYTLLTKRFQIRRGSATFIGGPDLNPTLQVTGEYQVQRRDARRGEHSRAHRRHAQPTQASRWRATRSRPSRSRSC